MCDGTVCVCNRLTGCKFDRSHPSHPPHNIPSKPRGYVSCPSTHLAALQAIDVAISSRSGVSYFKGSIAALHASIRPSPGCFVVCLYIVVSLAVSMPSSCTWASLLRCETSLVRHRREFEHSFGHRVWLIRMYGVGHLINLHISDAWVGKLARLSFWQWRHI